MKREESRQLEGLVDAVGVSVPVYNADSEWRGSHHRRPDTSRNASSADSGVRHKETPATPLTCHTPHLSRPSPVTPLTCHTPYLNDTRTGCTIW